MTQMMIQASGLHCHSCVATVTEELLELEGVSAVSIELVPNGNSHITLEAHSRLSEEQIQTALTAGGDYYLARVEPS
ncbi:MAG: heavy-metal-associated domain-containing protein [Mycobacteriaceae bacterium]